VSEKEAVDQHHHQQAGRGCLDQRDQIVKRDEAAPTPINPEPAEDRELDQNDPDHGVGKPRQFGGPELTFETKPIAEIVGSHKHRQQHGHAEHGPPYLPQLRGRARDVGRVSCWIVRRFFVFDETQDEFPSVGDSVSM